jgi:hypothetical protein
MLHNYIDILLVEHLIMLSLSEIQIIEYVAYI